MRLPARGEFGRRPSLPFRVMHDKIARKRSMGQMASMDFASSERSQLSRKKR